MPQERSMYKKVLDRCISFSINNIFNPIFQKEGEYSLSFEEIMTPCEKLVGGGGRYQSSPPLHSFSSSAEKIG
jgi:hypothetical protein